MTDRHSAYVIPATPEAREAVRQIRLDERRRLAKQIREIGEDAALMPRELFHAFIDRHPNYISRRLTTVISDTLLAVAEEIEQEIEEFAEDGTEGVTP